MNTPPNPISFMESIGAKVTNLNAALVEVTNEVEADLEQTLQSHLEVLNSTYSEKILIEKFAEPNFNLERYIKEVLKIEVQAVITFANSNPSPEYISPKNRKSKLTPFKYDLNDFIEGTLTVEDLIESAKQVQLEGLSDQLCIDVICKILILEELEITIKGSYEQFIKEQEKLVKAHLLIKNLRTQITNITQQSKVDNQTAEALERQAEEFRTRAEKGLSQGQRIKTKIAKIEEKYPNSQPKETTQSITTVQPAEKVRTDPTVLAEVAKRLIEQRESDQAANLIKTAKDTTQDPSPAPEQPVSQIDSLQQHEELLKAERQAEDLIVKGFELRIANYNTEKEIAKLRIVNKELLGTMKDHTIQIPTNLNLLLGKINKFKDDNQAAMVLPRLRNILIEKASVLGIDLNETVSTNDKKLFDKIEDFDFPNIVTFDAKTQEYFDSFIANPANAKLLPKILNLATSFNRYCERGDLTNVSNFYGFAVSDNGGFTKKSFFLIMNCENPKYLKKGLRNFIEFKVTSEKRIYITLNEQGQYQLYTTNGYFNGIH
jgi:hypothetical protein